MITCRECKERDLYVGTVILIGETYIIQGYCQICEVHTSVSGTDTDLTDRLKRLVANEISKI